MTANFWTVKSVPERIATLTRSVKARNALSARVMTVLERWLIVTLHVMSGWMVKVMESKFEAILKNLVHS